MYESFRLFAALAFAIFIEAMPFLVAGALISSIIEVYISTERLLRAVPKSIVGGLALGLGAGFVLPTCECGVVPIVRRLMDKGVPPYIAVAYMLAAPIVNPVVLASTYIAFRGSMSMVLGRILLALLVATVLALIARSLGPVLRTPGNDGRADPKEQHKEDPTHNQHDQHPHDHHHHHVHHLHDGHQHGHDQKGFRKLRTALAHAALEFMDMGKFLILGALIAAAFKVFLPENIMALFSGSPALAIAGMMLLAVLLSICSEADAFVAASFVGFSPAAQLAFIGIGPMVDLKLIGMYGFAFKRRLVFYLILVPVVLVFLVSWLLELLGYFNI